ncbi:3-isopropylmalate/(R)-2-methylmalate dehydratase small subunit [Kitasatospora sp. SolWspMP-SS2h]|uniref:3-isopropylmalate dehydratase small subunit n=1 Tax=Kitasatospora sp. SolWspMP-SS2h TaxID=1305729 RepID=UPI000C2B954D|nr:3-isopropylmalate dehydratase small subunit [Kitasatospora sp. SolWspMP-SS2h]RAJ38592.1 3-isopropylmalate/(R)-2-methylmalate dehydratase small subunit [Kitasatospora sp. SolWspMP-SS2h]
MEKFTVHRGTAVPLRRSDVDTDQIIPVRFCASTDRDGHADALFADWRDDPGFVLNRPEHRGATILLAGNDFGTGSSREYAVWALQDYGFRVVVAPRYGDIFRGNSLMNGLLTIVLPSAVVTGLWEAVEADPAVPLVVDLEALELRCGDRVHPFELDAEARDRLLAGLDPIDATLRDENEIEAYEKNRRPALPTTC